MADRKRKQTIEDNPFAKTEPKQPQEERRGGRQSDPEKGEYKPRGIGLYESEWANLEKIAGDLGITAHKLAQYAVRDFVRRYEAGEIKTEKRPRIPGLE